MANDNETPDSAFAPQDTSLPRTEALVLEAALRNDPRTRNYFPDLDDVGGDSDRAWVSLRVPKDKIHTVGPAVREIAQATLGRSVPDTLVAIVPQPLPPGRNAGR